MNKKQLKAEGSSLSNVILVAFAVLISVSTAVVGKTMYDESSKGTKIVNELTQNSPNVDNLVNLGVLDSAKISSTGTTVSVSNDGITGEKTITVTMAETGALVSSTVGKVKGYAVSSPTYSNGTMTFSATPSGTQTSAIPASIPETPNVAPSAITMSCSPQSIIVYGFCVYDGLPSSDPVMLGIGAPSTVLVTGYSGYGLVYEFTNDDDANITLSSDLGIETSTILFTNVVVLDSDKTTVLQNVTTPGQSLSTVSFSVTGNAYVSFDIASGPDWTDEGGFNSINISVDDGVNAPVNQALNYVMHDANNPS